MIIPLLKTIILSANFTAPNRWVTIIDVFPSLKFKKLLYRCDSSIGSIAAVGSSSIIKLQVLYSPRAMARRCH